MELKSSDFQLLFGSAESVLDDKFQGAMQVSSSKLELHLPLSPVVDEANVIEMGNLG
mgnify:CR=1 FL=1